MKDTVKIIGGKYRGKKLHFPSVTSLRPTPGRVKETLFNWLMNDIRTLNCLDLFAGSGALGFEAYSRGAQSVVLVEKNIEIYKNLSKQAIDFTKNDLLEQNNLTIIHNSAEQYIQSLKNARKFAAFDLIFLDPPFNYDYDRYINLITDANILKSGGLLYIESNHEIILDIDRWQKLKFQQAGDVFFGLYLSQDS